MTRNSNMIYLTVFSLILAINSQNSTIKSYIHCDKDSDCEYLNTCNVKLKRCFHKDFIPVNQREVYGALLIFIGSALSNAGGIGGGGLLIPVLLLCLNFDAHEAIPLSKLMILTGALTSFIMGLKNMNPYRETQSLDINIVILLIPFVLFGTTVGVTLNKITPDSFLLLSLTIILLINTWRSFKQAFKLWDIETRDKDIKDLADGYIIEKEVCSDLNALLDEEKKIENIQLLNNDKIKVINQNSFDFLENTQQIEECPNKSKIVEEINKDKHIFNSKIIYVLCDYAILLTISLFKGSEYLNSIIGVRNCSLTFWLIYFSYLPITLGLTYLSIRVIHNEITYRKSINFPYHHKEMDWTSKIFILYPLFGFIGGILAGLLGIGGGLIIGPMLLELGIHPIVSTSTSNFIVLFTSSSTSIQFILNGMMNLKYGVFLIIFSTFGSLIGTFFFQKLVEKTGRISILIFCLAIVLCLSTILIPIHSLTTTIQKYKSGLNIWELKSPC